MLDNTTTTKINNTIEQYEEGAITIEELLAYCVNQHNMNQIKLVKEEVTARIVRLKFWCSDGKEVWRGDPQSIIAEVQSISESTWTEALEETLSAVEDNPIQLRDKSVMWVDIELS